MANWIYTPYSQTIGFEDSSDALKRDGGYWLKREIEDNDGVIQTHTPYVPTDWNYTQSEKGFWDGLPIDSPVCPVCFMHRAWNGACSTDCAGDLGRETR